MKLASLPPITDEQREAEAKAMAANKLVWVTCRVCGLRDKVGLDNPALLCGPCRVDLTLTRGHVLHLRDTLRERLWRAGEAWERALGEAPADARTRWEKVERAKVAMAGGELDKSAFEQTWKRARQKGDAFSALLKARETYEEAAEFCNAGLERCEASLREIVAYEDYSAPRAATTEGKP